MLLSEVFSLLGTIAIFIAAILISSKRAIKPKVRIWAFTAYIWACIFLMIFGMVLNPPDWFIVSQQIFLFFINIKGIRNARKELKNKKRDPFEVIVPKGFWDDILSGDSDHEY